jgi:hypothetical protein
MSVVPAITRDEIRELVDLHDRYRKEAAVCADAGAFTAATVMMGSALEAMLVCTVRMAEHVLRPDNLWPSGDPAKWTLGAVLKVANKAGWFAAFGHSLEDAVEAVNNVRISGVHPAAYIRDGAWPFEEREFSAVFTVLMSADQALGDFVKRLPQPARPLRRKRTT